MSADFGGDVRAGAALAGAGLAIGATLGAGVALGATWVSTMRVGATQSSGCTTVAPVVGS